MPEQDSVAVVKKWIDAHNRRDFRTIEGLADSDLVVAAGGISQCNGVAEYRSRIERIWQIAPDQQIDIEQCLGSAGSVVVHWRDVATQTGPAFGLDASHHRTETTGFSVFQVAGGKIARIEVFSDTLGLLRQLDPGHGSGTARLNSQVVRSWIAAHQQRDIGRLDGLASPDVVVEFGGVVPPVVGLAAYQQRAKALWERVPDQQLEVSEIVAGPSSVAVRWQDSGTHERPAFGIQPTGKRYSTGGCSVFHLKNGKIFHAHVYADTLGLLHQLAR